MTAYPESEQELARQLGEAAIDHASFERGLKLCELGSCRATCCHDGVFLTADERDVIDEVIAGRQDKLADYGWEEPAWIRREGGRLRSITLEADDLPTGFPAHFPRTRCVFLDASHRCVLQRLAMDEERHPWWWKPISCWMHPLVLKPGVRGGRPQLLLPTPDGDPNERHGYPGFASCTPCGHEVPDGRPAWEVLKTELEMLGAISGRDFYAEISAVRKG